MFNTLKYLLLLAIISFFIFFGVGRFLARPAPVFIGPATSHFFIKDYPFKLLTFSDEKDREVVAWFAEGLPEKGAVILLHGIRSNRLSMIERAKMFYDHGFSVLMIDLQAHGESQGDQITFGYLEALSVKAAIRFARGYWPKKKVGVVGTSLGGASAVFAATQVQADAYILEAVFSTLSEAAENRIRIRLGDLSGIITPLLLWQAQMQLGFRIEEVSPLKFISKINSPIFLIAGEKDKRTSLANSMALYNQISAPKTIWVIAGAKHQDFYNFAGIVYKTRVIEFFDATLGVRD